MKQDILDLQLILEPTLENFIVGHNEFVLAQLYEFKAGELIYLWGQKSAGKTHLLKATTQYFRGDYLTAEQLNQSFMTSPLTLESDYIQTPLIAVDDVTDLNAHGQDYLFHLINQWRMQQHDTNCAFRLLLSGSQAPAHIQYLREDVRNRLAWGTVMSLQPLEELDLLDVFLEHALERGIRIAPHIALWLFKHYSRDVAVLMPFLEKIDQYSLSHHRALSIPLIKAFLEEQHDG